MLQRSIRSTLLLRQSPLLVQSCKVCSCLCGATIPQHEALTQRRSYAYGPAPGSRSKIRRAANPSPAKAPEHELEAADQAQNLVDYKIIQAIQQKKIETPLADLHEFLAEFLPLLPRQKGERLDLGRIAQVLDRHALPEKDIIAVALLYSRTVSATAKHLGGQMLLALSAAEQPEATIRIMSQTYIQAQKVIEYLRRASVVKPMAHLKKLASEGRNIRAMVLEGKIAMLKGNEQYAVNMWWNAMDAITMEKKQEIWDPLSKEAEMDTDLRRDLLNLNSPWIDLAQVFRRRLRRRRTDEAEASDVESLAVVLDFGVDEDDAMSYYYAACFFEQQASKGHYYTRKRWLAYMTKAAASGVPQAAYELGVFYAKRGCQNLEGRPEDHPRSTVSEEQEVKPELWKVFLSFLGVPRRYHASTVEEGLPENFKPPLENTLDIRFPATAEDHLKLGKLWLTVAAEYHYAPASLALAEIYLMHDMSYGVDGPPDPFVYGEDEGKDIDPELSNKARPENPIRNDQAGVDELNKFQPYHEVLKWRQHAEQSTTRRTMRNPDGAATATETMQTGIEQELSYQMRPELWDVLAFPDVFESWEADGPALVSKSVALAKHYIAKNQEVST